MARFVKRRPEVEAEQWFPNRKLAAVVMYQPPDAVIGGRGYGAQVFPQRPYPAVLTVVGPVRMSPGDWVVTLGEGEFVVIPHALFMATYERAP